MRMLISWSSIYINYLVNQKNVGSGKKFGKSLFYVNHALKRQKKLKKKKKKVEKKNYSTNNIVN
jgi:hypothetical protein